MRCPKCHHDNPSDTLFCEECDHRTDQPYRKKSVIMSPMHAAAIAITLGVISTLFSLVIKGNWIIPVCVGALGIVLGTYSLRVSREVKDDTKGTLMFLSVAAVVLSAMGFMLGIMMFE
ncbi:MAG: zinc ribbon domain-containing protein [Methanomassiliicoccaceae archaeon]|jgi:hypothetical protein|nr:zinc ribbon domain-containing protein [Methanomassiliicoccaceae archaeon]